MRSGRITRLRDRFWWNKSHGAKDVHPCSDRPRNVGTDADGGGSEDQMIGLFTLTTVVLTAPPQDFASAAATALATGNVFDGLGKDYVLNSQFVVESRPNITIKNANITLGPDLGFNPADLERPTQFTLLGFDRCENLVVDNVKITGDKNFNLIGFSECNGMTLKNSEFYGGWGRQGTVACTDGVLIENNRFIAGKKNTRELLVVENGHPWTGYNVARSQGYEWSGENRWKGGQNRGSWIGGFYSARVVTVPGTSNTASISWQNMNVKNPKKPLTQLEWRLWWPNMNKAYKFTCTSYSYAGDPNPAYPNSGVATVKGERFAGDTSPLPAGQALWFCFDPNGFSKNVTVRGNSFMWNPGSSGLSMYFVEGFVVENNSAHDNRDYGMGAEWCRNGIFRNNVAEGNQWMGGPAWNQLELVAFSENISFTNNLCRQVGVVGWGCPQVNVSSDKRIQVSEMPRNWVDNMTDPNGPILRSVFAQ